MRGFRHRRLCLGATGLLLLASLSAHTQLLFACELIDGAPKLVCCCDTEAPADGCDNGGGCANHNGGTAQACCEVTLAAELPSMTSIPHGQLLTLLAAAQLPPIRPSPAAIQPRPHAGGVGAGLPLAYTAFWLPGVQTYLYTNRFRI
ncbi:MAG: hypothetical protein ACREVH_11480 [Gammaproteobacteria bacterium]